MDNDGIVISSSLRKKVGLTLVNDRLDKGFQSTRNNFDDDFVLGVTQSYRSEVLQGCIILTFWDQTEKSCIYNRVHSPRGKGVITELLEGRGHIRPILLVHERVHPIRPRSFGGAKGKDNPLDLFEARDGVMVEMGRGYLRGGRNVQKSRGTHRKKGQHW